MVRNIPKMGALTGNQWSEYATNRLAWWLGAGKPASDSDPLIPARHQPRRFSFGGVEGDLDGQSVRKVESGCRHAYHEAIRGGIGPRQVDPKGLTPVPDACWLKWRRISGALLDCPSKSLSGRTAPVSNEPESAAGKKRPANAHPVACRVASQGGTTVVRAHGGTRPLMNRIPASCVAWANAGAGSRYPTLGSAIP